VIGLNACTSHLADIGGRSFGPEAADVHEEGMYIPPLRLIESGEINSTLMSLLKANSRVPVQNEGDLYALIACCEVGEERLADMMREFSFGNDGDFRRDRFVLRYNADLANDLGNLLNRTLGLVSKHFRAIPQPTTTGEYDNEVKQVARKTVNEVESLMSRRSFDAALEAIWEFVRRVNRYIQQTQVWTLAKSEDGKGRMGTILYNSMEALRTIAVLISPFMPDTANRIRQQMGLDESSGGQSLESVAQWGGLPPGVSIRKPEPIFPRKDTKQSNNGGTDSGGESDLISFKQFQSLDMRVAEVIAAEAVPDAERLLKLQVDLGGEQRQIVAGIAENYAPDDLLGKQVILVANLEPATIRGIKSQGMLLAAADGKDLAIATLEKTLPAGTRVR